MMQSWLKWSCGGVLAVTLVSGCTTRGMARANPVKRHAMQHRVLPPDLAEEICGALPDWLADHNTACRAVRTAKIYHTSWWRPANKVFGWVWMDEVHIRPDWTWSLETPGQLHLLVHELAHVVQYERDGAEKMLRNGLNGAGRRIAGMADSAFCLDRFNELIAAHDVSLAAARRVALAHDAQPPPRYFPMSGIMAPSLVRALETTQQAVARRRCALTALACEDFRLHHGRWPQTLDELVPEFLAAIPNDPYDANPLRLATRDDGITVYCPGLDGVDDGGDLTFVKPPPPGRNHFKDVGFRLLDPELRNVTRLRQPDDDDAAPAESNDPG